MGEVAARYDTSRQAIGKWRIARSQIEGQIEEDHRGAKKRITNSKDGIARIKTGVRSFYKLNNALPRDLKLPITGKLCEICIEYILQPLYVSLSNIQFNF